MGSFRNLLSTATTTNDEIIKKIARTFVVEKRIFDNDQIQKPLYSILLLLALLEDYRSIGENYTLGPERGCN